MDLQRLFYVSFLEFLAPQAMKRDAETVVCFKIRNAKKNGAKKKRDSLSLSNWMLRQLPRISPSNCSAVGAEGSILRTKTGYFSCPLPLFLYKRAAKDISFPSNPKITRTKTRFGKKKPPLLSTCLL